MELCMHEKDVFVLPVNILTLWRAGFLGCMTHYYVSWYNKQADSFSSAGSYHQNNFAAYNHVYMYNYSNTQRQIHNYEVT